MKAVEFGLLTGLLYRNAVGDEWAAAPDIVLSLYGHLSKTSWPLYDYLATLDAAGLIQTQPADISVARRYHITAAGVEMIHDKLFDYPLPIEGRAAIIRLAESAVGAEHDCYGVRSLAERLSQQLQEQIAEFATIPSRAAVFGEYVLEFIYIITDQEARMTKIGYSRNPRVRMYLLQRGCHGYITAHAVFPGTRREESSIHTLLAPYHHHGEWFDNTQQVRDFIDLMKHRNAYGLVEECQRSLDRAYHRRLAIELTKTKN